LEDLDWPILALTVVGRVAKVQTYGGKGKERAVSVPGDTENFIDNELNKIRQEANAEHSLRFVCLKGRCAASIDPRCGSGWMVRKAVKSKI
jgi:succinate dehydrogenase/fumarate reductase-like Fe-S protein